MGINKHCRMQLAVCTQLPTECGGLEGTCIILGVTDFAQEIPLGVLDDGVLSFCAEYRYRGQCDTQPGSENSRSCAGKGKANPSRYCSGEPRNDYLMCLWASTTIPGM